MDMRRKLVLLLALLAFCNAQSREGNCFTPNRRSGRCIPASECGPLLAILRTKPISEWSKQFLRQSQCGFQGSLPTVCCVNTNDDYPDPGNPWLDRVSTSPPVTKRTQSDVANHRNLRLLPTANCGIDSSNRIFGGNITALNEFPWTALLQYQNGSMKIFSCGGALISSRYVLTAAHCTHRATLVPMRLISVRLGEHNIDEEKDCEEGFDGENVCADPVLDIPVERSFEHPDYNTRTKANDISLVRLSRAVSLDSDYVRAICIPIHRDTMSKNHEGKILVVAGWGHTEKGSKSPVKLKVSLPVVSNSECARIYKPYGATIIDTQLCAGGIEGKDSCDGDSGGPLMSSDKVNGSSSFYVNGIVSIGIICGTKDRPGVYTRVSAYTEWILETITP